MGDLVKKYRVIAKQRIKRASQLSFYDGRFRFNETWNFQMIVEPWISRVNKSSRARERKSYKSI